MPLVILKSSYIKSMTHFDNLITYCDLKVEAQMIEDENGKLRLADIDEILRLDSEKVLKIQLENGKTVTMSAENFSAKYAKESVKKRCQIEVYTDENIEREFDTEKYLSYIANRPSSTGLFNQFGAMPEEQALIAAQKYANSLKWSHIVSLERCDAERLGFDNPQAWQNLIAAKLPEIAKLHNISLKNIVVVASYHDKDHHPHIHLFVYSQDAREGRFAGTNDLKNRTKRIKSLFTNEIFKGDLEHIKTNKNKMQTQMQQALRRKCIAIAQKSHSVDDEICNIFSQISDMLLDNAKGRKYYEYQNKDIKRKINQLLQIAVKSDENLRDIYLSLKSNQEKFVRAYNDSEETVKMRMNEWERRFFGPQKHDDKRLHNIIIECASKRCAANSESANYVLCQRFWDIVPAVCTYADISLDSNEISYIECEHIKKNSMNIAWQIEKATNACTDEEAVEKVFDKMFFKLSGKLLDKRLMSDNLHIALYLPNGDDYEKALNIKANAELDLFFTARKFAKSTYEELGEKALGCVIFVHNASDSGAQFEIQPQGKIHRIYGAKFAQKAAADCILPKRFKSFDEQNISIDERKLSRVHCLAVWKNHEELAQLKNAMRQALTVSQKRKINQIAQGKAFGELEEKEQKEICKIVKSAISGNSETLSACEKFVDSLYMTYRENFDESAAEKYREYTKKALLEPKENETSPLQNTAIFASRYIKNESPKKVQYHTKMLMFQLARGMSQMTSARQATMQENAENTRKKSPLTRAQNKHIALENGEEYDGYEY